MRYVWDPNKDAENRRRHGLKLSDGMAALDEIGHLSWLDSRFDHGEIRILNLGRVNGIVLFVVITESKNEVTRIISVRKAEKHEEHWYYHDLP